MCAVSPSPPTYYASRLIQLSRADFFQDLEHLRRALYNSSVLWNVLTPTLENLPENSGYSTRLNNFLLGFPVVAAILRLRK
jgi:hypothetical protein